MARQLRQTRGKKGPRKTRKQGKRKGGKTRKRVMGKRRKYNGGAYQSMILSKPVSAIGDSQEPGVGWGKINLGLSNNDTNNNNNKISTPVTTKRKRPHHEANSEKKAKRMIAEGIDTKKHLEKLESMAGYEAIQKYGKVEKENIGKQDDGYIYRVERGEDNEGYDFLLNKEGNVYVLARVDSQGVITVTNGEEIYG
tara:strand:+ start:152 stop:739 length:588 start_codon:yes stop_codon:yes gene_type:complete